MGYDKTVPARKFRIYVIYGYSSAFILQVQQRGAPDMTKARDSNPELIEVGIARTKRDAQARASLNLLTDFAGRNSHGWYPGQDLNLRP